MGHKFNLISDTGSFSKSVLESKRRFGSFCVNVGSASVTYYGGVNHPDYYFPRVCNAQERILDYLKEEAGRLDENYSGIVSDLITHDRMKSLSFGPEYALGKAMAIIQANAVCLLKNGTTLRGALRKLGKSNSRQISHVVRQKVILRMGQQALEEGLGTEPDKGSLAERVLRNQKDMVYLSDRMLRTLYKREEFNMWLEEFIS